MLLAAICAITLTVATRYCFAGDLLTDGSSSVKSRLVGHKVQRLALGKTAVQWLPCVERFSIVPEPTVNPGVVLADLPLSIFHLGAAISDRAPPLAPFAA